MEGNATVGSDTVDLPRGDFELTLAGPGEEGDDLDVLDNLTIRGAGPNHTTVSGRRAHRILWSDASDITLEDLTLTEGAAPTGEDGGAVRADGSVFGTRVVISYSEGKNGGGVYADGEVHLQDARIEYCYSEWVGAAIRSHNAGSLTRVIVRDNVSSINYSIVEFDGSISVNDTLIENNGGIGLDVEGDLDVTRTTISGNYEAIRAYSDVVAFDIVVAENGGGVGVYDGSLVLTSSKVIRSTLGDGLYVGGGPPATVAITDSVFTDNAGSGALIWVEEALLERNQFDRNQEYGLVLHSEGSASVSDVDALGNGMLGMYFASYYDTIEVEDARIARTEGVDENRALILDGPGTTLLRRVSVTDNAFGGVELYPGTNVTFEDSRIARNVIHAVYAYYFFPIEGSGIYAEDANLTLRRTEINGNIGIGARGTVYTFDTDLALEDCQVKGNVTDYVDPGVVVEARGGVYPSVSVVGSTFSNNVGPGSVLRATVPSTSVTNSSFIYNASGDVIEGDGELELTNVTIVANVVRDGNGALYVDNDGTNYINGVTIAGNHTPDLDPSAVAGLFVDDPDAVVAVGNSIIASNFGPAGPADTYGTLTSLGGNLIGEADLTVGFGATDLVGTRAAPVRPGLGPLYAPPTGPPVAPPRAGSLARDIGNDAICLPDDQLGAPRPTDGDGDGLAQCDAGAVEAP
jgi:hypothetical protein